MLHQNAVSKQAEQGAVEPRTSIIMPAYNVSGFIAEAIDSVCAQTREDWALIIVDDGSADDTVKIVKSYLDDQRITLIEQENAGAPVARNRAVAASQTEFLSLLDADDAYEPTYLEEMLARLEADPALAFCSCDAFIFEDARRRDEPCSGNVAMVPPVTLERVAAREFQVYTAASLRRSWFDKVGGYDAALRNAQDFDLWLRILAAGGKADYVGKPLAWYRRTSASLSSDPVRMHHFTIKVYEKLRASRPDVAAICDQMIEKSRYTVALNEAKRALRAGRYEAFHEHAGTALALRTNMKLSIARFVARFFPPLARALFGWRA